MLVAYRKSPYGASTNIALSAIFSFLVLALLYHRNRRIKNVWVDG